MSVVWVPGRFSRLATLLELLCCWVDGPLQAATASSAAPSTVDFSIREAGERGVGIHKLNRGHPHGSETELLVGGESVRNVTDADRRNIDAHQSRIKWLPRGWRFSGSPIRVERNTKAAYDRLSATAPIG